MSAAGDAFCGVGVDSRAGNITCGLIEESGLADTSDFTTGDQTVCIHTALLFTCDGTLFTGGRIIPSTVARTISSGTADTMSIAADA